MVQYKERSGVTQLAVVLGAVLVGGFGGVLRGRTVAS
jgi:hypothetical protein